MDTQLGGRHRRRTWTIHQGRAQRVGRGALSPSLSIHWPLTTTHFSLAPRHPPLFSRPSPPPISRDIADSRGGVTCLYETQLPGACLHASESGGRYRPQAVRGMPDVPIAPPATGPPEGWAAVGFVGPASFNRGLWARLLRVLGSERVRI